MRADRHLSDMVGSVKGFSAIVAARRRVGTVVTYLAALGRKALSDYNNLESTFLISAELILLSGMVFYSRGFAKGSVGYVLLTVVVAVLIVSCSVTFATLVVAEVYRSFRDAAQHEALRQLEVERNEHAMLQKQSTARQRGGKAGGGGGGGGGDGGGGGGGGGDGSGDNEGASPTIVARNCEGAGVPSTSDEASVVRAGSPSDGARATVGRGAAGLKATAASWQRAAAAVGTMQPRRVGGGGNGDGSGASRAAAVAIAAMQPQKGADSSRVWVKALASYSANAPMTVRSPQARVGDD
jgi:hypothetical protein